MRGRVMGLPATVVAAVVTAAMLFGACVTGARPGTPAALVRERATTTTTATPPVAPPPVPTTAPAPPPPPMARTPVVGALEAALGDPALAGRPIALAVTDAHGMPVMDFHAGAELLPASTQKLVTAAAALRAVGPEHRYVTHLNATAPPGPDGVLHGSLVLVGAGDPALGTPEFGAVVPERPRTPLEALADHLAAAGVRRVTGDVLADPWVFPHEPVAPGWLPRYVAGDDTAYVSGLTVNGGRRLFHAAGRVRSVVAADPATEAAVSLRHLLVQRGVAVDGVAGAVHEPPPAPVPIGGVASPPMVDLLAHMVRESDNHIADAVFRTVGLHAGDASWAASARAVRRALDPLDLDWAGTVVADGSGLSRANRISPRLLAALDLAMTGSPAGGTWQSLLPVAGVNGTLERRLVGSLAHGRVLAKTGSLRDVRALAGQVHGQAGRYHFAILANGLDGHGRRALRHLQDRVVLALARDLHGCNMAPLPGC